LGKQYKITSLLLILIITAGMFPRLSEARRAKGAVYYLEEYNVVGTELGRASIDSEYSFLFPVSVSTQHVLAYLWSKNLIAEGILSKGLPLIYLDAHLDSFIGRTWTPQSSNWVRAVLDEKLCSSAALILPQWVYEDINMVYRVKLYDAAGEIRRLYQHSLSISDLEDLPAGKEQTPVVLSIDCDYFSNMGYPNHRTFPWEIEQEIAGIINILKDKGIKIAALNIAISPGYTYLDQETFIRDQLLLAFSEYGKE